MLIDKYLTESDTMIATDDIDKIAKDPETPEGQDAIADEIEASMRENALKNVDFFSEDGGTLKNFMESTTVEAMLEARKFSKKTFVRLGKEDDLTRRTHMGCLILARESNHPEFKKMMFHRKEMKNAKAKIIKLFTPKALRIAKVSQKKHIKDMRNMPDLPKIK